MDKSDVQQARDLQPIGEQALREARAYHTRRDAERAALREAFRRERRALIAAAIGRLAPGFPGLEAVYLFGSLVRPGAAHRPASDIDVAVLADDLETESRFWQALEAELQTGVDLRPLAGAVARAVADYGEVVYVREVSPAATQH